jgi:shikimate dehydrogenase
VSNRPLPALAGVIGWPISHSKSPRIHRFWLEDLAIEGDYVRLPVAPAAVSQALRGLPALGFRGVNVTVPHKRTAFELCDALTPLAERVGAVNTVVVQPDGSLLGHNTDVAGVALSLEPWTLSGQTACLLGAGGAARAVVAALANVGVATIKVAARNVQQIGALQSAAPDVPILPVAWDARHEALPGAAVLINATSLGMTGEPPLELDLSGLPNTAVVNDIVYAPLETPLLAHARARGLATIDGLHMLIGQAAEAFALFYGAPPNRARDAELRARLLA